MSNIFILAAGKFSSSSAVNVAWLYTSELYPTNLRAQALSVCSLVARVFGTGAPFVAKLSTVTPWLPMLLLGLPAGLAGLAVLRLPETRGRGLTEVAGGKRGQSEVEC